MFKDLDDPILGSTYAWVRALNFCGLCYIFGDHAYRTSRPLWRGLDIGFAVAAALVAIIFLRKFILWKIAPKPSK
jgi:hypothetical protein